MTLDLNVLKRAILNAATEASPTAVHKMNLIGRPSQRGTIEMSLGIAFSSDQRVIAARAFEELRATEHIRPTFSDLVDPENWVEITQSGREALTTDIFEPPPTREREQKFGILWSIGEAGHDFEAWSAEDCAADRPTSVLFLDIDRFKELNTTYTEAVVDDAILRPFQQLLREQCSHRGEVYRHGGDEFVVILRNVGPEEAIAFAERLRSQLAASVFRVGEIDVQLTVSIGVASSPAHGKAYQETLGAANKAKREAKAMRNTVRSASSPMQSPQTDAARPRATSDELEKIVRWFESSDADVRLSAAGDLLSTVYRKQIFHDQDVRAAVRRLMKDPAEEVRYKALQILVCLMQAERDSVKRYYASTLLHVAEHDTSLRIRSAAMTAIGATGDTYYCEWLYLWMVRWPEEGYRQVYPVSALVGLAHAGLREKIRNDLRSLLERTYDPEIKARFVEALKAVGQR